MFKQVTIYGKAVRLTRVRYGPKVVWASDPKKVFNDLKHTAIERRKVKRTTKAAFNKAFTKEGKYE